MLSDALLRVGFPSYSHKFFLARFPSFSNHIHFKTRINHRNLQKAIVHILFDIVEVPCRRRLSRCREPRRPSRLRGSSGPAQVTISPDDITLSVAQSSSALQPIPLEKPCILHVEGRRTWSVLVIVIDLDLERFLPLSVRGAP